MHIFISYAKADTRDLALKLQAELRQIAGVTVWMDESIEFGKSWAAQIQSEIHKSDVIVILLSPDVNRDPELENGQSFVINEIEYAQRHKKSLIPIMVRYTDMPIQIATLQYIDFTQNHTSGTQNLVHEIARRANILVIPDSSLHSLPKSSYRRNYRLYALLLLILVGAIVFILLRLDIYSHITLTSVSPTASQSISSLVNFDAANNNRFVSSTIAAADTSTAISMTLQPTRDREATLAAKVTATISFRQTATELAQLGIQHNTDWIPQYQTFDGVEMVLVPIGCFMMGSENGEDNEKPVNKQCIQKSFWIDKTEVTNQQYGSEGYFKGDAYPRDSVTWTQAQDSCAKRGDNVRLPTELEWEYAARGPDSLVYPWGNDFVMDNVVYSGNSSVEVGSKPAGRSWVGTMDMSGNLWEWVSTIYGVYSDEQSKFVSTFAYPYNPDDGRENLTPDDKTFNTTIFRVMRGGSWVNFDTEVRTSYRAGSGTSFEFNWIGFRCVRIY